VDELSQLEKLDLVAKAEASKVALSRARVPLTLVTLFIVLLAIPAGASHYEMAAVRAMAVLAIVMTAMLWLGSRYASYAVAIVFLAFGLTGWFFDDPDYHTLLGSTTRTMSSAIFLFIAYYWWTNGTAYVMSHSKGFENERLQVTQWMNALRSVEPSDRVIEFSSKNFVRGYWTYRLLNTGSCWMTARFKTGNMRRWLTYRVLMPDAVYVREQSGGRLLVRMGDRAIEDVEISPDMRDRLLHSVSVRHSAGN
jgi:hypothetical protein